jgi:hypothetical protein
VLSVLYARGRTFSHVLNQAPFLPFFSFWSNPRRVKDDEFS